MKIRRTWLLVPPLVLALAACKKNEESTTTAPAAESPAALTLPAHPLNPVPTAPVTPALTPEKRAEKLGFARYVPTDAEQFIAVYNGTKSVQRVKNSKIWKLITDIDDTTAEISSVGAAGDAVDAAADAEEAAGDTAADGPGQFFAGEISIILGKSSGEQLRNLFKLNETMSYYQMKGLVKTMSDAAKTGDASSASMASQFGPDLIKQIMNDPEGGLAVFEKFQMLPITVALRPADGKLEEASTQIGSLIGNLAALGPMVEPANKEVAGAKFTGYKILGTKLAEQATAARESLESMLDPASVDKIIASIAKKDIVVLGGTIGEYSVIYLGPSADQFNLASAPADSILGGNTLSFVDTYIAKDIAFLMHASKDAYGPMIKNSKGMSNIFNGLRDGFASSDGLGDTKRLQDLLKEAASREAALREMISVDVLDLVAFHEDGLRVEASGGGDNGALDWDAKNRLASLGSLPDVALFASYTADKEYKEKSIAYLETLTETAYAAAVKASELDIPEKDFTKFKQAMKIFDTDFRNDVVSIASTVTGELNEGLGRESALIIDLGGSVPPIPNIPKAIVDGGKFPRITVLAPVEDRAKLSAAWDKTTVAMTNILAKASKLVEQDLPMQKPVSSEKDGFITWFFPLPMMTDDFMPSITLNDDWFAMSTSKLQAVDLLNKAAASNSTDTGLTFHANFARIQEFCRLNLKLMEQNSAALKLDAADLKQATKIINAMDELDKLIVRVRKEGSDVRTSIHFKTR
ncbi:MAG: hypothetical protein V4733_12090 [Verrucomicrobiota bacterium]